MRKPSDDGGTARHLGADDPTVELGILEDTISIEGAHALRRDALGLEASPIPRTWVLAGDPVARKKLLTTSSDKLASTFMWDCTAGQFDWFYDTDEVIHVLEGSVLIEDEAGASRRLQAGDTFLFAAGTRYHWTVSTYIRKVAFIYSPLSREMRIIRGVLKRLTAPFRRKRTAPAAWG